MAKEKLMAKSANTFAKKEFTAEELIALTNALLVANNTSNQETKNHFDFLGAKYCTLDKIPYEEGMKLVQLVNANSGASNSHK